METWVGGIKINRAWTEQRGGRTFHLKRRLPSARFLGALANGFFRAAGSPMRLFTNPDRWAEWEILSFNGLHSAEGFTATTEAGPVAVASALPGVNLTMPLDRGWLTPEMTVAAGRELRRAHLYRPTGLDAGWSHADPHLGNFIYDEETGRARIIDFEVAHDAALTEHERQVDDVLVFLQDLIGRVGSGTWVPCALGFISGYGKPEVISDALRLLDSKPGGFAWIWMRVRTSFLTSAELERRVSELKQACEDPHLAGGIRQ